MVSAEKRRATAKGSRGKKGGDKGKATQNKVVGVWVWAQCDNDGCQKWRKLPPGTVIDDKEPWFCYMNPDPDMNDCNIPEEEYNQLTEAAIYSHPPSDDEKSALDGDAPWSAAEEANPRWKGGHMNGRTSWGSSEPGAQFKRKHLGRRQNGFMEDSDGRPGSGSPDTLRATGSGDYEDGSGILDDKDFKGPEGRDGGANEGQSLRGMVKARRAHLGFNKLLAIGGVWEITKGKGKAVTAPPSWVWEGLATHAPSGAQLACQAADASSAARYFEIAQAPRGSDQAREAANNARLALTAAAAMAVRETGQIPGINDAAASGSWGQSSGADVSPGRGDTTPEVASADASDLANWDGGAASSSAQAGPSMWHSLPPGAPAAHLSHSLPGQAQGLLQPHGMHGPPQGCLYQGDYPQHLLPQSQFHQNQGQPTVHFSQQQLQAQFSNPLLQPPQFPLHQAQPQVQLPYASAQPPLPPPALYQGEQAAMPPAQQGGFLPAATTIEGGLPIPQSGWQASHSNHQLDARRVTAHPALFGGQGSKVVMPGNYGLQPVVNGGSHAPFSTAADR